MVAILAYVVPVLIAIYTANYARWAWQHGLKLGSVFLALLALLTIVVPSVAMLQIG